MTPSNRTLPKITLFQLFRPILLGILLFVLVNAGVSLLLTFTPSLNRAMNAKVDNHLPQKYQQLQALRPQPVDVLFLGTSQTNNDFATLAFEEAAPHSVSAFNLGLPGTRYDVMKTLLAAYIQAYGKPKHVFLEINDPLVEDKTVYFYLPALHYRTILEHYPNLFSQIWGQPDMAPEVRREFSMDTLSSLYQFRSIFSPLSLPKKLVKVVDRVAATFSRTAQASDSESSHAVAFQPSEAMLTGGWQPKGTSGTMQTPKGVEQNALAAKQYYLDPLDKVNFTKLDHFLAYCQSQKIPVVLVQWPNHPAYNRYFERAAIAPAYHQEIERVRQKYQVTYLDLNKTLPPSVAGLFADARHLTPQGAFYFSKVLAEKTLGSTGETP